MVDVVRLGELRGPGVIRVLAVPLKKGVEKSKLHVLCADGVANFA